MNQSEGHSISIQEQKSKIRERYRGLDPDTVECLPARPPENIYDEDRELRVAVYARVCRTFFLSEVNIASIVV